MPKQNAGETKRRKPVTGVKQGIHHPPSGEKPRVGNGHDRIPGAKAF